MPGIAATSLFSSLKYIDTDNKGNLLEAVGAVSIAATATLEGLKFTASDTGAAANGRTITIQNAPFGAANNTISFVETSGNVEINLGGVGAVRASLVYSTDLTFSAASYGKGGNALAVKILVNQGGLGNTYALDGNTLTIGLVNAATSYTAQDLADDFNSNASAAVKNLYQLAVTGTGSNNLAAGGLSTFTALTGGADAIPGDENKTNADIVAAYATAPQAVKDLISVEAVTGGNTAAGVATLAGGADSSSGELDPSAKYVLIKQSDLHGLEDTEQADGRKLVWGIIHKASEVFAAQVAQPDNLKITKSVPTSADSGTSLKQVYTITAKYAIGNLDLKDE